MKKRMVSAAAAAVMAVSLVSACSNQESTPAANESKSVTTKENAEGFADYSSGFEERITIKIPVYDRGFEGWNVTDNYYTKWIQENFGEKYNVDVKFVSIGRTSEVQDYMQMIAAGSAPDLIMHYDMPQAINYYSEGAMQNLDLAEVAFYAPDYYEQLKDTLETYGRMDGENIFLFAERNQIYYNYVKLIRKDWLDQVGLDVPADKAELYQAAEAWKEAGLGVVGDKLQTKSFVYMYGVMPENYDQNEAALYLDLNVAPFTWEPTRAYLRQFNESYHKGLIDPEFYLNKNENDEKADFISGRTGVFGFYLSAGTDVFSSLMTNCPEAELAVLETNIPLPSGLPGTGKQYFEYPPYGMIMGINSKTSDEARAAVLMYLNWMTQPENLMFLQNGIEGETYQLDEDGIAFAIPDYTGTAKLSNNYNKDYWCLVQEVVDYGDEEKNFKYNLKSLAPEGYEYIIEDAYRFDQGQAVTGIISPVFTTVVESSAEYAADLNAMWQEFYVACVTCDPAEFDAKYEAYCKEYLENGYQEILDEKQEKIDNGELLFVND